MRVRIKKDPFTQGWNVQVKYWWSYWIHEWHCYGTNEDAKTQAIRVAQALLNPLIIEVKA